MPMRRAAAFLTLTALALTACGGDDGASDGSGSTGGDTGVTAASSEPSGSDSGGGAPDTGASEAPDDDRCQVEVTGDKTASWTSPGGISAVNTDYWLTPEQKEFFGEGFYFILNCDGTGEGGSISFFANTEATAEDIPFGPATYTLSPAENALGSNTTDPITVLFTLEDSETNWGVSEPGVLEITAFDDDHIAGRFEFTATDVLADLSGGESEGTVTVTGSFDYRNPN